MRGKNVFQKSFIGIAFHGQDDKTYDAVYCRPFNFIAKDCGAPVLQHGVRVSGQNLLSYMDEHEISLDECTCYWNEDQIEGKAMRGALAGVSSDIVLSVITG